MTFGAAELQPHATACISVGEGRPSKGVISAQQWQQLKDVLQWRNPAVSALVVLLCTFTALAVDFVLRGNHKMTPLKGALPTFSATPGTGLQHEDLLLRAVQPCHTRCWRTWHSTSCAAWCPAAGTAAQHGPAATPPGRRQRARSRCAWLLHACYICHCCWDGARAGVPAGGAAARAVARRLPIGTRPRADPTHSSRAVCSVPARQHLQVRTRMACFL